MNIHITENWIKNYKKLKPNKKKCYQSNQVLFNQKTYFPVLISISTTLFRSSRSEVFCKKGVPRNFAKFTRKHLYQSPFCNNGAGLTPKTLLKKRLWHRFSCEFGKYLRTSFLQNSFGGCFCSFIGKGKIIKQSLL